MTEGGQVTLSDSREHLKELFGIIGIKRVVIVDDVFTASSLASDMVAKCVSLVREGKGDQLTRLDCLSNIQFERDEDQWRPLLDTTLADLGEEARNRLARELSSINEGADEQEEESYGVLRELLDENGSLKMLSLDEWKRKCGPFLKEKAREKTLFLFDRDMTQGDGRDNEGMMIIAKLLKKQDKGTLYCGLLTRTVAPEGETCLQSELSDNFGLEDGKDQFIVVSKEHLQQGDTSHFVQRLKRVILAPKCASLRKEMAQLLQDATAAASSRLSKVSVYDFEQIVFQSSLSEGVWEPDTLIRIFSLFHRKETLNRAHANAKILETAQDIRRLVKVPWKSGEDAELSSRKIQSMELYEDGEHLGRHHLPIELGDVFQKSNGARQFILLAQPCDLMVRNNGKRSHLKLATLVPIKKTPPTKEEVAGFELPFFDTKSHDSMWVHFNECHFISVCILDMCVYDQDGEAQMVIGDSVPIGLVAAWCKRYQVLQDGLAKSFRRFKDALGCDEKGAVNKTISKDAKVIMEAQLAKTVQGIAKGKTGHQEGNRLVRHQAGEACAGAASQCNPPSLRGVFES